MDDNGRGLLEKYHAGRMCCTTFGIAEKESQVLGFYDEFQYHYTIVDLVLRGCEIPWHAAGIRKERNHSRSPVHD